MLCQLMDTIRVNVIVVFYSHSHLTESMFFSVYFFLPKSYVFALLVGWLVCQQDYPVGSVQDEILEGVGHGTMNDGD